MQKLAALFGGGTKIAASSERHVGGIDDDAAASGGKGKEGQKLRVGSIVDWGTGRRGVVTRVVGYPPFKKDAKYHVRLADGSVSPVLRSSVCLASIEASSLPLNDLPLHVLALVLFWLPMRLAAEAACVSRRFSTAFGDNVAWKRRCLRDVRGIDVEATFEAEKHQSWIQFYRRHADYRVQVLIVHYGSYIATIDEPIKFLVNPRSSISTFLDSVRNNESTRGLEGFLLYLHNPAVLRHDYEERVRQGKLKEIRPNCSFSIADMTVTVAEAGLCDGAVLELRLPVS